MTISIKMVNLLLIKEKQIKTEIPFFTYQRSGQWFEMIYSSVFGKNVGEKELLCFAAGNIN